MVFCNIQDSDGNKEAKNIPMNECRALSLCFYKIGFFIKLSSHRDAGSTEDSPDREWRGGEAGNVFLKEPERYKYEH